MGTNSNQVKRRGKSIAAAAGWVRPELVRVGSLVGGNLEGEAKGQRSEGDEATLAATVTGDGDDGQHTGDSGKGNEPPSKVGLGHLGAPAGSLGKCPAEASPVAPCGC
ncbi:conserved hypothetical protein [Histoplasma capsulatum H143]|uniref:Uncharacterized protein n=1 Tax=Ajellomyces capsulatus (strain H143) TaxID=544712 RepID=C6HRN9_AJECH|nr:conserved hypothetical protein [Histoplasma capsulatum H143]